MKVQLWWGFLFNYMPFVNTRCKFIKLLLYIVLPYKPNILLIHSILSCKLFAYICKFLYLYTIILADIYA